MRFLKINKCYSKYHLFISRNSCHTLMENMEVQLPDSEKVTEFNTIRERTTEILEPPGKKVFYNPVQEFNRDLSVLVLQHFSKQLQDKNNGCTNEESRKPFRILEALSATGLRSIRYAKEVPNVTEVIANDVSSEAVKNIKANIKYNNVEDIVKPSQSDASALMFNNIHPANRFQVVDIDPYGSPSQFLDTAVQCVADGGLLLVTCTDMSTLCGNFPETCYAKYGALSLKCQAKHEMALRIVLQCIQLHAAKYKRYIVPILSVSADFYIRIIVKLYTSPATCKTVISKISMVYHCCVCGALTFQPLGIVKKSGYSLPHVPNVGGKCIHCGGSQNVKFPLRGYQNPVRRLQHDYRDLYFQMGGPIWNGPIHDKDFVSELISSNELQNFGTSKRILGMLTMIQEELCDIPLYYSTSLFSKLLKVSQIPIILLRSAVLNAGYRVSDSHCAKYSVKTDAPMSFMFDLYKAWLKENPSKQPKIVAGSPGERILNTPIENKIDFSERKDANPASREMGLCRYQINPAPYWGPGCKSTTIKLGEPKQKKQGTKEQPKTEHCQENAAKKQKTE